jgi:hypothetical protein
MGQLQRRSAILGHLIVAGRGGLPSPSTAPAEPVRRLGEGGGGALPGTGGRSSDESSLRSSRIEYGRGGALLEWASRVRAS